MSLLETAWLQAVTGDTAITVPAGVDRQILAAAFPNPGVVSAGDYALSQNGAGDFSVNAAMGRAIAAGSAFGQGSYEQSNDAAAPIPLPSPPSSGTRWDRVVLVVQDKQVDGTGYTPSFNVVQGTSSTGTPTIPTLPPSGTTWAAYLPLGRVLRTANESSVLTAAIYDERPLAKGVLTVATTAAQTEIDDTGSAGGTSGAILVTSPVVLVAGRRYQLVAYNFGTVVTVPKSVYVKVSSTSTDIPQLVLIDEPSLAKDQGKVGTLDLTFTCTVGGLFTVSMTATVTGSGNGGWRTAPGMAQIVVKTA